MTPIWFMRQAGRYLAGYRKIREKHDVISICKDPELSARISTLPVEILDVDAAILFADIMLPLEGMNVKFEIKEGVGPIVKEPIRNSRSVRALGDLEPNSDVPFVLSSIKQAKKRLNGRAALIGFAGAPFTLASYLVEGRASRDFAKTKALMYRDPEAWNLLMEKLALAMTSYLRAQIRAGADAVQLFDSWIGCLNSQDYDQYVLPYSRRIFNELEDTKVPRIHFGTGTSSLLKSMRQAGGDVFGVDWRIPIDIAWERVGHDVAIQGNLDPAVLLADFSFVESRAADILRRVNRAPGHIFNLGHGMLPDTHPGNVIKLVKYVHGLTQKQIRERGS